MGESLSDFNKKLKTAINMGKKEKKPYISMNKLAEYMQADPIRRREIVKILKQDKEFTKTWYSSVWKTIPKYFKSEYDDAIIDKDISKIKAKKGKTDWDVTDNTNSVIALKRLINAELPDLTDYKIVNDIKQTKYITLSGVRVSLKPDIYLRNKHSDKIGALKSHVAKTQSNRLDEISREFAATLLKIGFIAKGYKSKEIDSNACISLDVFEQRYSVSPRAYKLRKGRLEAACEEIFLRWESM